MYFFFNDTATTEIYTLSLHDALPIFEVQSLQAQRRTDVPRAHQWRVPLAQADAGRLVRQRQVLGVDRKSTRLNSSHANISYAVFLFKKKTTFSTLRYAYIFYLHPR